MTKIRKIPITNKDIVEQKYEFIDEPLNTEGMIVGFNTAFPVNDTMEVSFRVRVISPTLLLITYFVYNHGQYYYPDAEICIYEQ